MITYEYAQYAETVLRLLKELPVMKELVVVWDKNHTNYGSINSNCEFLEKNYKKLVWMRRKNDWLSTLTFFAFAGVFVSIVWAMVPKHGLIAQMYETTMSVVNACAIVLSSLTCALSNVGEMKVRDWLERHNAIGREVEQFHDLSREIAYGCGGGVPETIADINEYLNQFCVYIRRVESRGLHEEETGMAIMTWEGRKLLTLRTMREMFRNKIRTATQLGLTDGNLTAWFDRANESIRKDGAQSK